MVVKAMRSRIHGIRIGLAQMNPTVGDLDGNLRTIRKTVREAKRLGVQLLAFPEMMICGYPRTSSSNRDSWPAA